MIILWVFLYAVGSKEKSIVVKGAPRLGAARRPFTKALLMPQGAHLRQGDMRSPNSPPAKYTLQPLLLLQSVRLQRVGAEP